MATPRTLLARVCWLARRVLVRRKLRQRSARKRAFHSFSFQPARAHACLHACLLARLLAIHVANLARQGFMSVLRQPSARLLPVLSLAHTHAANNLQVYSLCRTRCICRHGIHDEAGRMTPAIVQYGLIFTYDDAAPTAMHCIQNISNA